MSATVRDQPRVGSQSRQKPLAAINLTVVEMAAIVVSILFIGFTIFYHFHALTPPRERLAQAEALEKDQIVVIAKANEPDQGPSQPDTVEKAKESLEQFKQSRVKPMGEGRIAAIREINELVQKNGLRLSSGIDVKAGGEGTGGKGATGGRGEKNEPAHKKDEISLDVYPAASFGFTVIGQYTGLRKFLSEIEQSKQFVIVRGITFTGVDEKLGGGRGAPGGVNKGGGGPGMGAGGAAVTLAVQMTAYFRP